MLAALLLAAVEVRAWPSDLNGAGRRSVVKIHVTAQYHDFAMPWRSRQPMQGTGTGFIVKGRRILTNAHVVSNCRVLEVQKDGAPNRYRARPLFIAHDCDMALLEVTDPGFFEDTRALPFAADLPDLNSEVVVLGYPLGGNRLSVTRGVVSRIDYSVYSHSGADEHLALQVDAAINPGNSGGPILYRGRVVALAFQGLAWADNIGYGIPGPVIRRFLDDVEDGTYDGYPELGVGYIETRNEALRRDLDLPASLSGVAVSYVDPFGSANGLLQPRDVLLSIDDHPIDNAGGVDLDGNHVVFAELLERKQRDDSVRFDILRGDERVSCTVPLARPHDPFMYPNLYDQPPRYVILGGLVFSPLTREYLKTLGRKLSDVNSQQLLYFSLYAKIDGLYQDRDEFVVMIKRLPHTVNTYAASFLNGTVADVNGRPVRCLDDLREAARHPVDGYHLVRFENMDDTLVLSAAEVAEAEPEIARRYGLPETSGSGEQE